MTLDSHLFDDEEPLELSIIQREIQVSPRTGMSSDYYNELSHISGPMLMEKLTILGALQYRLRKSGNNWRLRTYEQYFAAEGRQRMNLLNEKSQIKIPLLDTHIGIINAQINSLVTTETCDVETIRKAWNEAFYIVTGDRETQI